MGRNKLAVPTAPINASIPLPDLQDLDRLWSLADIPKLSRRRFITEIIRLGCAEARRTGFKNLKTELLEEGNSGDDADEQS